MPRYKDDGYPKGVYFNHGAFYKIVSVQAPGPGGILKWKSKRIPLGKTEQEMYARLAGLEPKALPVQAALTINDAINDFKKDEVPKNSAAWQKRQTRLLDMFGAVFGHREPNSIKTLDIKNFLYEVKEHSLSTAWSIKSVIKVFFNYMIINEYCELKENPARLVKLESLEARDRDVSEEEFWAFYNFADTRIKIAMLLARGTGIRRFDLVTKTLAQVDELGLKNEQHKRRRGKKKVKQLFTHNAYIEMAIQLGDPLRRECGSIFLIPSENGTPYTVDGFSTRWRRKMGAAVKAGVLQKRFGIHDVRAMVGGEQEDYIEASKVLGNTPAVAKKHYRRKHELVTNKAAPTSIVDLIERSKLYGRAG